MRSLVEFLSGACDFCIHARRTNRGYWYCTCHENDYFPEAEWDEDEDDSSECPSYDPDPDAIDEDDCAYDEPEQDDEYSRMFDKDCDPDEDMSGESTYRSY